jgi:hypothetical protein
MKYILVLILVPIVLFLTIMSCFSNGRNNRKTNINGNENVVIDKIIIEYPKEFNNNIQNVTIIKEGDKTIYYPNIIKNYSIGFINESMSYHEKQAKLIEAEIVEIEKNGAEKKTKLQEGKISQKKYLSEKEKNANLLKGKRSATEKFKKAGEEWQKMKPKVVPDPKPKVVPDPKPKVVPDPKPIKPQIIGGNHTFTPSEIGFEFDVVIFNGVPSPPDADGSYFANPIRPGDKIIFKKRKTKKVYEFQY